MLLSCKKRKNTLLLTKSNVKKGEKSFQKHLRKSRLDIILLFGSKPKIPFEKLQLVESVLSTLLEFAP
jgi:hypothetical protein